jgi:hypothetical protein
MKWRAWRRPLFVGLGLLATSLTSSAAEFHTDVLLHDQEGQTLTKGRVIRSWSVDAPVPGQDDDHFEYRPLARVTLIRDGLGRVTRYHRDERCNITATVVAPGTQDETRRQTPFDASGNRSGSVDPLGRRTTCRFDLRGNLTPTPIAPNRPRTLNTTGLAS